MTPPVPERLLRVVTPAPRELWRRAHRADSMALVTQSPEWTDVLCAEGRYADASRAYLMADDEVFVLPAVRRRPTPFLASMPESWGMGGLVGTRPIEAETVAAVFGDVQESGDLVFRVRPNPLQAEVWKTGVPSHCIALARRAHVLDLSGGFEQIWEKSFHADVRRKVRRAEAAGVEAVRHEAGDGIEIFYDLFEASLQRWAVRQNEPARLALARGRRRDPIDKFRTMAAQLGDSFRLWTARVDGRPAAALIVLQGVNAHYTRGAIDEELAGKSGASYLLQRLAIEDACNSGCGSYHMGETGRSEGLARFKEHLGAAPHEYAEYRMERFPATRIDAMVRGAVKRVIGFRDA